VPIGSIGGKRAPALSIFFKACPPRKQRQKQLLHQDSGSNFTPFEGDFGMNSRIVKLAVLGTFFLFSGVVFFISGSNTGARDNRAVLLETVRNYKTWQLVTKKPPAPPANITPLITSASVVQVDISSISG
jgi:hypothetical protein